MLWMLLSGGILVCCSHTNWRGPPQTARDAVAGGLVSHRATAITVFHQTHKVPKSFLFSYKQWEMLCVQTAICWATRSGGSFYFLESFHKNKYSSVGGSISRHGKFPSACLWNLWPKLHDVSYLVLRGVFQIYRVWLTLIVLEKSKLL